MSADDVTAPLELALQASALVQDDADRRPRLLSDNGPSYVTNDLSEWLEAQGMRHSRGKSHHAMTQGQIERWHLSLKSSILLENHYLPVTSSELSPTSSTTYNPRRYHESLDNLTPADLYFGRSAHPWNGATRSSDEPSSNTADTGATPQHELQPGGPTPLLDQTLSCPQNP